MRGLLNRWAEAARAVGDALLEVLAAEAAELQRDLTESGRTLRRGLVLLAVAASVAFWTIGLGLWLAVELLRLWMPAFGAALVMFATGVIISLLFHWRGKQRLRKIENPIQAVQRRSREHAEWWQEAVLPGLGGETPPAEPAGNADEAT